MLAAYYSVSKELIHELANIPQEDRIERCREYGINPKIIRTMMDYTRYHEAARIHQRIVVLGGQIADLKILDYGCLVADYGLYFSRLGADVAIYDIDPEAIQFALARFRRENLAGLAYHIPTDYAALVANRDLAIFGEVLEHMHNPLEVLHACVEQKVNYIFTSCYPFGSEKYFSEKGHSRIAQTRQPDAIKLLVTHYRCWPLEKQAILWQRREQKDQPIP